MDDYPELPWSWQVPPGLKDAWLAANRHQAAVVIWTEGWARPQLTRGVFHPPSWSGHRDACPTQWGGACDCDLPPRTTPCTCRYWTEAYNLRVSISDPAVAHQYVWPLVDYSGFTINPRCHHHGDRARTPQPAYNDTHNPYDLDEDERHD
jgi:hypothetical protein